MVFDSELQQQQCTIAAAGKGYVNDVAELSNDDQVLAASDGLYHSTNGECVMD